MSLLDEICVLAVANKAREIENLLETYGKTINFQSGILTAVEVLAVNGEHAAVKLLLSLGAHPWQAIYGYALRGDWARVQEFVHDAYFLECAVSGFARGNHQGYVNHLLLHGGKREYAAQGYAQGNHQEAVAHLLQQGVQVGWAIRGEAINGESTAISIRSKEYIFQAKQTSLLYYYALAGKDPDQLINVFKTLNKQFETYRFNGLVCEGYAKGDYTKKLNTFIKMSGGIPSWVNVEMYSLSAVRGYATGNHCNRVNALIADALTTDWLNESNLMRGCQGLYNDN